MNDAIINENKTSTSNLGGPMNVKEIIALARKHLGNGAAMDSSARSCVFDAVQQYDEGNFDAARKWALKALSYSVGVFHKDYRRASK